MSYEQNYPLRLDATYDWYPFGATLNPIIKLNSTITVLPLLSMESNLLISDFLKEDFLVMHGSRFKCTVICKLAFF